MLWRRAILWSLPVMTSRTGSCGCRPCIELPASHTSQFLPHRSRNSTQGGGQRHSSMHLYLSSVSLQFVSELLRHTRWWFAWCDWLIRLLSVGAPLNILYEEYFYCSCKITHSFLWSMSHSVSYCTVVLSTFLTYQPAVSLLCVLPVIYCTHFQLLFFFSVLLRSLELL